METIDAVWRAIDGLSVDLKMALLLRDVVGLSYNEIADSLEVTLATVKWRIYKGREEVAEALGREGITVSNGRRTRARRSAQLARRRRIRVGPAEIPSFEGDIDRKDLPATVL